MTLIGAYEKDYHPGHIRNINSEYISGTLHSSQGNYGMDTVNYPAILSTANITGGTTLEVTGSAVYTAYYKSKTFYVSCGSFVPPSGMMLNIEGSWSPNAQGDWYNIYRCDITGARHYYSSNTEHHPYIRARISTNASGASGTWMVNIVGSSY